MSDSTTLPHGLRAGVRRDVPEREFCTNAIECDRATTCPVGRPLSELSFRDYWCPCNCLYVPSAGLWPFGQWWAARRTVAKYRNGLGQRKRRKIHERDGFKCASCGARDVHLEVHHIIAVANFGSHDPENLVSLCWDCHRNPA